MIERDQLATPPVIGGRPAKHSGENNHPIRRVVIHSAVMPCEPGRARQLAEWNRSGATGGSWHYAVDPAATYQCSWDRFVCWHAPPNRGSIGIEMADHPGRRPTGRTAAQLAELRRAWRWARKPHRLMLRRTARLTAEILVAEGLPPRFLTVADLRAGREGWTTHRNVSRAWGQSSHWDPGWWPRRTFARLVRRQADLIRRELDD